jgi:hypothetical protein
VAPSQGKRENLLVRTANLDQLPHKSFCAPNSLAMCGGLQLVAPSEGEGEAIVLGL